MCRLPRDDRKVYSIWSRAGKLESLRTVGCKNRGKGIQIEDDGLSKDHRRGQDVADMCLD